MAPISDPTATLPERPPSAEVNEPPVVFVRKTQGERLTSAAWDVDTKRTVVIVLLIVAVVLIWAIRSFIPLLAVASIIAYFLSPVVDLAQRVRVPRALSTLILYLLLFVGIVLTPVILVPILLSQLASLNFDVPTTAFRLFAWVGEMVNNMPAVWDIFGYKVPLSGLTTQIEENIRNFAFIPTLAEILGYFQQAISAATNVVSSTAAIGVSVVGGILQVFITILLIFFLSLYMTKDSPEIRRYIEGLFPRTYQSEWIDLLRRMGYIWQSFFRGQLILCLVVGVTTWMALELAGMPGALLLGILAGTLEIIPTLGPTLSMIPAVIIALIQGSSVLGAYGVTNFGFALITVAIYFIIQQLENYILVPRIIGRGVNLHPIVVLVGVGIGVNLFGILGALFAAPVIASLRVLGAYIHAKLLDYAPFQDQPLPPDQRRSKVYRRTVRGDELPPKTKQPVTSEITGEMTGEIMTEPDSVAELQRAGETQRAAWTRRASIAEAGAPSEASVADPVANDSGAKGEANADRDPDLATELSASDEVAVNGESNINGEAAINGEAVTNGESGVKAGNGVHYTPPIERTERTPQAADPTPGAPDIPS